MKRVKTALLFNDKYKQGYSYIMANPTTAAEWKQVAANSLAQIKQIESGIDKLYADRKALDPQINVLVTKRDNAADAFDRALFQNQIRALLNQQIKIDDTISEQVRQVGQLSATYDNANQQAKIAETGPPNTDTNTPPTSDTPNQANTTVTTTTQPIPEEQPDPNDDANTNIDDEIETPDPQVDPEVDEFAGIDDQIERQRQIEDGSLEFAGIDEQIAINENTLEEPPVLNEEEVDSYIRQAGQQDTIESPNSTTENTAGYQADPTVQTFDDGSSIQTFDDGSTLVTDADGNVTSTDPGSTGASRGLSTSLADTRGKATAQDVANFQAKPDWRVRLSLAPGATYLYKAATPGILAPLAATDGVIFPYTPSISVQYAATYDPAELTHSNYKFFTYRGSAVDSVTITCDFTAQDTFEANYLLAVIHFFRSVTKMFYGQDQNPKIGTPPPLCYLSGLGAFQFDAHPLAVTSFNYALPTDVDYIRAGSTPTPAGVSKAPANTPINSFSVSGSRANANGVNPGGGVAPPQFTPPAGSRDVTYVPTKMSISIQAVPIVTRNDISNKFSLTEYATGKLLRGTQRQGGGIW